MRCAGRATQDGQVIVKSSDKTWSTGGGNGKPLQYSYCGNPIIGSQRVGHDLETKQQQSLRKKRHKIIRQNKPLGAAMKKAYFFLVSLSIIDNWFSIQWVFSHNFLSLMQPLSKTAVTFTVLFPRSSQCKVKVNLRRALALSYLFLFFTGLENHDTIIIGICYYIFVKTHRMYNTESKPKCQLCMTVMYQCWFIDCNKCTTVVPDVDGGRGTACVRELLTETTPLAHLPELSHNKEHGAVLKTNWENSGGATRGRR